MTGQFTGNGYYDLLTECFDVKLVLVHFKAQSHTDTNMSPTTHQMQILWLIVQLSKDLMVWVSRRLCYAVGDTGRAVSYVGPRFIVSSERLGEWSLYTI